MQPPGYQEGHVEARQLVERFWQLMASNDFFSVAQVCADDLVVEWPQSGERFVGVERFASMNRDYPAHGVWQFALRRLVAEQHQVVSEVAITDGVQQATAISFFSIQHHRIERVIEYWPDVFAADAARAHLVDQPRQDHA